MYNAHPDAIDPDAIARANSIWDFDRERVIGRLGFPSVEAYYRASSARSILPELKKPTPIVYAADDPLFDRAIVPDLQAAGSANSHIDLVLTRYGGHLGYLSSNASQRLFGDPDPWWDWNRVLEWCDRSEAGEQLSAGRGRGTRERDEGEGENFLYPLPFTPSPLPFPPFPTPDTPHPTPFPRHPTPHATIGLRLKGFKKECHPHPVDLLALADSVPL